MEWSSVSAENTILENRDFFRGLRTPIRSPWHRKITTRERTRNEGKQTNQLTHRSCLVLLSPSKHSPRYRCARHSREPWTVHASTSACPRSRSRSTSRLDIENSLKPWRSYSADAMPLTSLSRSSHSPPRGHQRVLDQRVERVPVQV